LYNVFKNLLILKLQSYKNNSKPQIKALKIAFESLHFGKVLIARRATTFAKVSCPYGSYLWQSLLL